MALRVSEVFMAGGRAPESDAFRLAQHHIEVLRDVARGAEESDAGLCCSYLADVMSGEGADFDEFALTAMERFADRATEVIAIDIGQSVTAVSEWRSRVLRCRRSIRRLRERGDHKSASVLLVAHGYPDPIVRQLPELNGFGPELGSLARYTDAVEVRRREMVEQEAGALNRFNAEPVQLGRYRERRAFAERATSSADALRQALAPFGEVRPAQGEGEGRLAYEARLAAMKDRQVAHKSRLEAFVTEVKLEARRMLMAAERAYHGAWLACQA